MNITENVAQRVSDVTGAHKRRQMERIYHNRLRALLEVSWELCPVESQDELCRRAIELGRSRLGFDRLSIWFVREDGLACKGMFGTDESGNIRDERSVLRPFDPSKIGSRPAPPVVRQDFRLTDAHGFIVGQGCHVMAEIWGEDRFLGLVNADNLLLRKPMTDYDIELLALYAASIGHLCVQHQKLDALKRERTLLRTLFDSMTEGVALHEIVCDEHGEPCDYRFLEVNRAFEAQTGLKASELIGKTVREVMPEVDPRLIETYGKVAQTGKPVRIEDHAGADKRWYQIRAFSPDRGRFAAIFADVTDRKQAEAAQLESERRFRNIVESVPIILYSVDGATGDVVLVEGDVEEVLGYGAEEFYADPDLTSRVIHPEDVDRVMRSYQDGLACGDPFELEYRIVHGHDKRTVWVYARVAPVTDDQGRLIRHDGVVLDITKRKEAEIEGEKARQQLLHSQKLQSLGTLVGGIAHDFNNMLTIITGNATLLEAWGQLPPAQVQQISDITTAARQATEMTRSLQALSKPAKPQIQRTDVNQLVNTVHRFLRRLIPATIEFRLDADPHPCVIAADPGQIQQVLVNLCVNARDAMPGGGVLEIQTRTVPRSSLPDGIRSNAPEDEYIRLRVTDNGAGMDEATLTQAFDPFFSTKPKDRGTGLGLAVVYRVVDSHNGFVDLSSHPNQGTCCDVYLPAIQAGDEEHVAIEPGITRTGTAVLVVEDEEMVASLLRTALETRGYKVTVAMSPREGIEIAESGEHPFDLAIVDYSMPEMTGDQCIAHLRRTHPNLKVILMTGYSIDEEELSTPGVHVVHKPFSIPTLLRAVQAASQE